MGRSDSLPSFPAGLWLPSAPGTTLRSLFTPVAVERYLPQAWGFYPGLPIPAIQDWRRQGLPGSWGTPCAHALLSDPDGTSTPGHHGASVLPSVSLTTSAPTTRLTGLHHTA